jgi:hypothetical protein
MSEGIPAIYENGVFRPVVPVDLPEGTQAVVTPSAARKLPPGEGILASAGAWADADEDFQQWLAEWRRWREMSRDTSWMNDESAAP